jgi:hypothetical protein
MKKSSLSLTALVLSLTALLLSALLLTSCETKAARGTSPKVSSGKQQALNGLPHAYEVTLKDFAQNQVN